VKSKITMDANINYFIKKSQIISTIQQNLVKGVVFHSQYEVHSRIKILDLIDFT